ncbi:hypothetical protein P8452_03100 [Trifolium repens]|nr:hypothetical protein P8452_03100 [Trifolium repens]
MDEAKEEIRAGYNNKKKSYKPIWDIIDKRWDKQLHRPLHAAGYFLNPKLTKKKVERRRRELTIDDFQDDDDWWYVAEQENAVANQMLADLDAELMHTNGTTSATSPTHEDEFHIADDGEESDNEADDGSGARDGDGDDDDDDDDDDDGGDDDEINEDDDDDIMGDNPSRWRLISDII